MYVCPPSKPQEVLEFTLTAQSHHLVPTTPKAKCWARLAPVRHTDSRVSKTVTLKSRELSQAWQHKPVIPADAGGLWVLGQSGLYSNRLSPRQTNCRDGSMGKAGPEFKSHHSTHVCLFQEKRARHNGAHL